MPNGNLFKLAFDTHEDSFQRDLRGELARVLRNVADRIENKGEYSGTIFARDGSAIGAFSYRAD